MIGKLVNNQLMMPLCLSSVTLSSAQILALFTTPVQIAPGVSGCWLAPVWGWAEKPAGIAYTIGAATKLGIYYSSLQQYMDFPMAGFVDQVTQQTKFSRGPGTNATQMIGSDLFATAYATGLPLMVTNSVANLTVGNTTLKFTILYHVIPYTPSF